MCVVGDENVKGVDRYSREKTTSRYILRRRDVVEEKKKSSVQEVNSSIS